MFWKSKSTDKIRQVRADELRSFSLLIVEAIEERIRQKRRMDDMILEMIRESEKRLDDLRNTFAPVRNFEYPLSAPHIEKRLVSLPSHLFEALNEPLSRLKSLGEMMLRESVAGEPDLSELSLLARDTYRDFIAAIEAFEGNSPGPSGE